MLDTRIADRFAIEALAGEGGMGSVYRARDLRTGDVVALKVLHPGGDAEDLERFQREAELLAEMAHPAIVTYVAHGATEAGQPFLVMEWLEGEDLAARLTRGPLTPAEALALVRRTAEALAVAHRRGVVHRDLKPANLFLRGGALERVTLVDFGIARRTGLSVTRTGAVIGTPAYMAPEQACGDRQITAAADVFALGCVLFECLTGQTPFVADQVMAMLARIVFDEPTPLRALLPDAPEPIEALLARMLAKSTAERCADAAALLSAIDSMHDLRLSPAPARPGGGEQQLLSVLLALPPPGVDIQPGALSATLAYQDIQALHAELSQHGARPEVLADGSLVVVLRHTGGVATDQAAEAARCALLIKARWPAAVIALGTGRGLASERSAAGEVLDRAAALLREPVAAPGSGRISLDEVTAGLLEMRFVVERSASGACLLTGEEVALDATRPLLGKPTPCVGRDVELAMLEGAFAATAGDAEPRAVVVIAPPGAGKSRLRHELVRRIEARGEGVTVWIGRGDPIGAGSPYGILGQALRRRCGILGGEDLDARRAKLARHVGERVPLPERGRVAAFLGELCDAPLPDEADVRLCAARRDPQIMEDQIVLAVLELVRAECAEQPLLLVLEDLHWSDALTVKLVDALLRGLTACPLMVLALARPEVEERFPRLWGDAAQVVSLPPLGKKAGEKLVQHVLGKQVAPATMARIVTQSEGNALLLEELIRASAEGRGDEAPATVLAMLQARIARLPAEARRVLRAGSVFGRSCWRGGIAAVLGVTPVDPELDRGLAILLEEEILEERREGRFAGEQEHRFRHALMRDAAYGLLAEEERAVSHRRAGEYLQAHGEPDARTLAEHFLQGRDTERAIHHYVRAAEQSHEANDAAAVMYAVGRGLASGARGEHRGILLSFEVDRYLWGERYEEALAMSTEALGLLPEGSRRWCWALQYLFAAASYLQRTELSRDLMSRFARVVPARDALSEYARAAGWLVATLAAQGQKRESHVFLDRVRRIGAALPRGDVLTWAHIRSAEAAFHVAIEEAPWSLMRCNAEARDALRAAGEQRTQLILGSAYGKALLDLGDAPAAEADLRDTLARAERLNETLPLAFARAYLADLLAKTAPVAELAEPTRLAAEVLATNNLRLARAARSVLAEVKRRRGDLAGAEVEARAAREAVTPQPAYSWEPIACLSRIVLGQGRAEEARALAEDGVKELERLGLAGRGELELRVALASALAALGRTDEARSAVAAALPRLKMRLDDIPAGAARERYLTHVPASARLVALATEWLGESVTGGGS